MELTIVVFHTNGTILLELLLRGAFVIFKMFFPHRQLSEIKIFLCLSFNYLKDLFKEVLLSKFKCIMLLDLFQREKPGHRLGKTFFVLDVEPYKNRSLALFRGNNTTPIEAATNFLFEHI